MKYLVADSDMAGVVTGQLYLEISETSTPSLLGTLGYLPHPDPQKQPGFIISPEFSVALNGEIAAQQQRPRGERICGQRENDLRRQLRHIGWSTNDPSMIELANSIPRPDGNDDKEWPSEMVWATAEDALVRAVEPLPGTFTSVPGPSLVADISFYVSLNLVYTHWIYHPTEPRAFIVSPRFYARLRDELARTSLTGNAGRLERALYGACLAVAWAYL